jgi:hypothetical protein
MPRVVTVVVVAVLVGLPADLSAQRVTGLVADSGSSAPIAGAVVAALDSVGGLVGARTLSDAAGRFVLLVSSRVTRLRIVRIGFQPREMAILDPARDGAMQIKMQRIPFMLGAMRASEHELCPGSSNQGQAFQLWNQARAGLLASVVARESKPAAATTITFERQVRPDDDVVQSQKTASRAGRTTRPFKASERPEMFAERGYATDDATGGRTYNAPDADVLLDESFAAVHCFHLQRADASHPGQIGLAFTPIHASGRDTLIDVSGTIWLDGDTPALRTLEFRFTGLEPAAERSGAGGNISFRVMPNGVVLIERWMLRVPAMLKHETTGTPRSTRRGDRTEYQVADVIESGGEVLEARWDDGAQWMAPRTGIAGTVVQSGSRSPLANAIVSIQGTSDSVTTNELGEFELSPLVSGRYLLVTADTTLEAYGQPRQKSTTIDVPRGRLVSMRVELPSLTAVVSGICGGQRARLHTSTVLGRLLLPDRSPRRTGEVHARWQADYLASRTDTKNGMISGGMRIDNAEQTSTLDAQGRFVICGVARDRPIHLRLVDGDYTADTVVKASDTQFQQIEWRAGRRIAP